MALIQLQSRLSLLLEAIRIRSPTRINRLSKKVVCLTHRTRDPNTLVNTRLALEDVWTAGTRIIFFAITPRGVRSPFAIFFGKKCRHISLPRGKRASDNSNLTLGLLRLAVSLILLARISIVFTPTLRPSPPPRVSVER